MIILGIDPGLAHTGWGILETRNSTLRARAYDCIATDSKTPLDKRCYQIYQGIVAAIERYTPSCVAVEKIFFGENQASAIATAHARGALLTACASASLSLFEYTPMQIKEAVVGTGTADKRQVIYMVRNICALDHDPRPDHCADALAAAICLANRSRTQKVLFDHAAPSMLEQLEQEEAQARARARARTQAATQARIAYAHGKGNVMNKTRQSRRNTK